MSSEHLATGRQENEMKKGSLWADNISDRLTLK